MSMPTFPQIDPPLTREGSLNEIIASIAAEELSLSHILNAEGEKLQYVLGTLPGLGAAAALRACLKSPGTPSESVFFRPAASKMLGIHPVFLRFFPCRAKNSRPIRRTGRY